MTFRNPLLSSLAVYPPKFHNMVRQWVQDGLQDLSVSRQRDRLQWGIPVPGDSSQTVRQFSFFILECICEQWRAVDSIKHCEKWLPLK